MFKKYKNPNFTGRINAFRVIERLESMEWKERILGGQNTESVKAFSVLSFLFLHNKLLLKCVSVYSYKKN